jgi:FkbM family methyltransferase
MILVKYIKKKSKKILLTLGYKISKINNKSLQNEDPFKATKSEINNVKPIIFDVGMNHGQTLKKIKSVIPLAIVHGFEPSKYCYNQLNTDFKDYNDVFINNKGLSDEVGKLVFNEYSWDALNSFLNRAYGSAQIIEKYDVQVTTLDRYCLENHIKKIHILKSDTEGFELKVLKGAKQMMNDNAIKFILIELFFDLNFNGQSSVGEIFSYLERNHFTLVKFYEFSLTGNGLASKVDALFINENFKE